MTALQASPAEPRPQPPRLLDRVREAIRIRRYSRRTEKAYIGWIRRYILFHGKRHPVDMGETEITRFLSSLAVDAKVSASTQNQALSALLFLYREVWTRPFPGCARSSTPRPRGGVAGIGQNSGGDILSRLKIQNRFKKKGWTHYSMFEVHDNVTREEIRELEALLLAIFRDDPRIELANKQKGSKRLDELCKPSQWKGS